MLKRLLALVVAGACFSFVVSEAAYAADIDCSPAQMQLNLCVNNGGEYVGIGGDLSLPGSGSENPPAQTEPVSDGPGTGGGSGDAPSPSEPPRLGPCRDDQVSARPDGLCLNDPETDEPEAEEDGDDAPVIPPVQATDVASFAPATPAIATEPDGVAIVGMPMNVVVDAAPHTAGGSLFGLPVSVSFTPVEAEIDYGDGTVRRVPIGGGTWRELGQPEFTATATSHAYSARGHYTVTARVLSSAVVDFGPYGTRPVNGLVASAPATRQVQAVVAETGLVQHTCAENPRGPGC